ncbi:3-hydroxyacyl-CoA dehydrogenase NAD-binding domain-containing protein [Microbacterium sp. A93]|uniref:3-hydroxyacyl-CoA dehydrogenase NAD-binding domain-containing protein n=1 Tax=Microbacterium sp. A93 TaxID=3450716 RepID=UPI003F422E05
MNDTARITRIDHDGIAVLTFDYPDRSMNVVDESVFVELREQMRMATEDDTISAVVLTSGKPGAFGAGADVSWLPELVARPGADEFLASVHQLMADIADSPKPYVAAVHGAAFGGALEVALSMHAIVAARGTSLGLPEITLGLIPGGAGTQLIRRFVDTSTALDLLLSGRTVDAAKAQELGLVAAIADDDLLATALATAQRLVDGDTPRAAFGEDANTALAAVAERQNDAVSFAAQAIIDAVRTGIAHGYAAGCAAERSSFVSLVDSAEAKARIHLFTTENDIKRRSRRAGAAFQRVGVVGGGQMGSGIAATAVSRGLSAVVRDMTDDKLDGARSYVDRVLTRSAPSRKDELIANWAGTTGWSGFESADAVIEAVFELPAVKRETLELVSDIVAAETLVATNTSAIPVSSLASAVDSPERFLGMHFFSPVERMPLVELVPHSGTSAETVERAGSLARSLGKLPVVVADKPGFFTSRVYARWLMEGVRLLLDGADPAAVDSAAKAAGFPIGPLQAHDEATLDLVVKASITQVAEPVMADRLKVAAVRGALEALIAAGVEGRRFGAGFYTYQEGRRTGVNPVVVETLSVTPSEMDQQTIADRLLLAFATECFLCWEDGTILHPDDGDVASVLGIGFPRALGGPYHWAGEQGLDWVIARCAELGESAFPVGSRLPLLATSGASFATETRLATPAS